MPLYVPLLESVSSLILPRLGSVAFFLNGGGEPSFVFSGCLVVDSSGSATRGLFRRFVGRLDLNIGFLTADSPSELSDGEAEFSLVRSEMRILYKTVGIVVWLSQI